MFIKLFDRLLRRHIPGRRKEAQRRDALDHLPQRLPDERVVLLQIGWRIERVFVVDRQAKAGPRLLHDLLGAVHAAAGHIAFGGELVEVGLRHRPAPDERQVAGVVALCELQVRLLHLKLRDVRAERGKLVSHRFDGVLQIEPIAAGLRYRGMSLGLGGDHVRFCCMDRGFLDRHLNLIGLLVELDQQIAFLHAIVVVHQHASNLPRDPRRHKRHMAVDISIVGRNRVQRRSDKRGQPKSNRYQHHDHNRPGDPSSPIQFSLSRRTASGNCRAGSGQLLSLYVTSRRTAAALSRHTNDALIVSMILGTCECVSHVSPQSLSNRLSDYLNPGD